MGLYDFIKEAGKALGFGGDESPTADALKKELNSTRSGRQDDHRCQGRHSRHQRRGIEPGSPGEGDRGDRQHGRHLQIETNVSVPAAKEPRLIHGQKRRYALGDSRCGLWQRQRGQEQGDLRGQQTNAEESDKIYPGQVLRIRRSLDPRATNWKWRHFLRRRRLATNRTAIDPTINRVPSAFTVGRIPISTWAQMYMGSVLPPPIVKNVTPKVSSDTVKTMSAAAMIPGHDERQRDVPEHPQGLAPRSAAAESSTRS